jgi:transposase
MNFNYEFNETETNKFIELRNKSKDMKVRDKLLTLILLATLSLSTHQISLIIGVTQRTIENWLKIFQEENLESLLRNNYKPKQPYLNRYQKNQLKIFVSFEYPETLKEVVHYVETKFDVKYSEQGMKNILNELGLKCIRRKPIPGNTPSVEKQKEFIEQYHEMRNEEGAETIFCDGMHLVHQNEPNNCWADPAFPSIIETNTSRQRLTILGGYNPADNSLIHLTSEENCNAERVIDFFELVSKIYNAYKINIVIDNAKYFHATIVKEWLEKNPRINLVFLPPYAPNLNLIERFWKFAKKKLVKNKYYKKYKEFRAAVFRFLNNVKDHAKKIKKLMTEKFQIIMAQ